MLDPIEVLQPGIQQPPCQADPAGGSFPALPVSVGWLCDYAIGRDPALRQRIILAYLGLADRLASRYRHSRGTTPEDLRQTARAGLIAAVDRYDPTHGDRVCAVRGRQRGRRAQTPPARHQLATARPRPLKEQALQVCKTVDQQLQQALGRSPTTSELAKRLQMAEEQVLEVLAVARCR
jgi:RNA polymerase sigma-B factor